MLYGFFNVDSYKHVSAKMANVEKSQNFISSSSNIVVGCILLYRRSMVYPHSLL